MNEMFDVEVSTPLVHVRNAFSSFLYYDNLYQIADYNSMQYENELHSLSMSILNISETEEDFSNSTN